MDLVAPSVRRAARGVKRMAKKKVVRKNRSVLVSLKAFLGPVIGDKLLAVEYQGGEGKAKRSTWRHDFKGTGAQVIGLKDGSVLLKRGTKPLWRLFK